MMLEQGMNRLRWSLYDSLGTSRPLPNDMMPPPATAI